ncbi:hypothetical protein WN943_001745 [Citrus x changshan-huyou]
MEAQEGSSNVVFGTKDKWELEEDDVFFKEDESMPYIAFSQRIHDRVINERLKRIWSSTMGFSIIDLANDYYLVHYRNEKDVEYALTEGPWTVMGYYLTVQQWSSDFDIATNKIDRIVAWIRLSDACPDGGVTPLATELPIPCPDAVNQAIMVGEVSDWNESKFGSWMVVTRKPCPRRPLEMESPKIPVQDQHGSKVQKSWFDVLRKVVKEETVPQN